MNGKGNVQVKREKKRKCTKNWSFLKRETEGCSKCVNYLKWCCHTEIYKEMKRNLVKKLRFFYFTTIDALPTMVMTKK